MGDVVQFGRRGPSAPPPKRAPLVRPLGVFFKGSIVTGNLEEHLIQAPNGDSFMPITYITVNNRCQLLMNCADKPVAADNDF